jgi:sugar phosphate isomerase/epimerase
MMKIGFSTAVCPGWDLETVVAQAAAMGFDGVELRGLRGELHLPLLPELAAHPRGVRESFEKNKVELVCLGSSVKLDSKAAAEVARQKAVLTEFLELAERLGCPLVRLFVGEVQRRDDPRLALARIAEALSSMAPVAARHGVTLLVENGGDFPGSADLWYLIDAVNHFAVRACWNQCHAMTLRERPTNSIPRLGHKIGLVHLCDADFDGQGVLLDYRPLGQGHVEVARQIELLRGLIFERYLVFEWPKLWVDSLPAPESVLPGVAAFLKERLAEKQPILSAYKGDKNAPRLSPRAAGAPA